MLGGGDLADPATLKVVATGAPNEVEISWAAVAGATDYNLYQSATTLSGFTDPVNLMAATPNSPTAFATATSTVITLTGTNKHYFLVTSTQGSKESFINGGAQAVATAHSFVFGTVAGGTDGTPTGTAGTLTGTLTGTVWMDRNLGADQVATAIDDTLAFGDYYQWGRRADGHQLSTSSARGTQSAAISPSHAQFITGSRDWIASGVDNDGAGRAAFWSRIDGSGICPTGFRVPTIDELSTERLSWSDSTRTGAFASNLKWTIAGSYDLIKSNIIAGISGHYWSSAAVATDDDNSYLLSFNSTASSVAISTRRAVGNSVRCIQD